MRDLSSKVKEEIAQSAGSTVHELEQKFPQESPEDLEYALWLLQQNREITDSCGQYRLRQ